MSNNQQGTSHIQVSEENVKLFPLSILLIGHWTLDIGCSDVLIAAYLSAILLTALFGLRCLFPAVLEV